MTRKRSSIQRAPCYCSLMITNPAKGMVYLCLTSPQKSFGLVAEVIISKCNCYGRCWDWEDCGGRSDGCCRASVAVALQYPRVLITRWRLGFGGLPAPWGKPSDMIALAWLDWYISSPYIERFTWPLSKRLINPSGLRPNRPLTPLTYILLQTN